MPKYARVIVDQSGSQVFDYEIPDLLAAKIEIGSRVRVPVRMRMALATVIEILDRSDVKGIRPIEHVIGDKPIFNPSLIRLGQWIATYYCCPIEVAMRSILPQVIRKAEVGHKQRLFAWLAREIGEQELADLAKKAPKQAEVLVYLSTNCAQGKKVAITKLAEDCGTNRQTLQALEKKGAIVTGEESVQRDPYALEKFLHSPKLEMNEEQVAVFESVKKAIVASDSSDSTEPVRPLLLHGVTGSGKTEIYLQAIELVLAMGKTAIVLVPEISLTPQTVERFKSRFSDRQQGVAVLHSHLSQGERHDEWHKINDGSARIVIGARSAVFAPVRNLGLIVVDEEHENTYKQEESPRYHARDIAVLRASLEKCAILLGSATPSIESFHNATTGKYELLRLTKRVDDQKMPFIRVVDMRLESLKQKGPAMLSDRLFSAITDRLAKKEQTILFLNRRGFSTSLVCSQCGYVCECPNCSVSLTFHRAAAKIVCHICGHNAVAPTKCPDCKDPKIRYSGTGTEKVEELVARVFPTGVVRRMDADAMTRKEAYKETLGAFRAGKIDILIGTQMISKGLHFPNVTLVGIINADLGLHMPDFRAGERTFQLLTQVAGRAGRGDVEGEVFIQSYTPFHPAIQFARHHDFQGFWDQEIEFRKQWDYPPYTHMVLITVRSPHQVKASFSTETLARRLKEDLPAGTNLGNPAPAPLEKSHGNFRFQIMLRTRAILKFTRHLHAVLDKLTFPEDVIVTVDVDPYQLL